ncbi:efflux RND transporter permease subunit, partial [Gemmatimonadota bacterium]
MNLPALAVKRAVTFSMLFIGLTGFGLLGISLLPMDLFPNITFPVAVVITDYSGASPEDVEALVTRPVEEAISSVSGIKNIMSESRQGVSFVILEFDWGSDMDQAKLDIRENIEMFRDLLPAEINNPLVFAFDPSMMPIAFMGLRGDLPTSELRRIGQDVAEPLFERIPGVSVAETSGGLDRQIQVRLDPTRLRARQVSAQQVIGSIRSENVQLPTGTFDQGRMTYAVHAEGKYASVGQIAETIVGYAGATPIKLRDVANVRDTFEDPTMGTHVNGEPGVLLIIMKQSDANTVDVANRVVAEVPRVQSVLPAGVRLDILFEQASFIQRSLGNLANTAMLAFLMAGVVLLFFLQSVRASVIVALSIPLSIMAAGFAMYLIGITLNIISLAGLALAVGMLVDNSIVVLENTVRFIEDGETPRVAAVKGPSEILMAIVASTLTTISVFIPVLFVPGIAGVMFRDMALTICVSLAASLVVAVSLVPLLGSRLLLPAGGLARRMDVFGRAGEGARAAITRLERFYRNRLEWVLNNRGLTLAIAFVVFVGSMALVTVLDAEFIPESNQEQLIIEVERAPGTSLTDMEGSIRRLESIAIENVPEAYAVISQFGSGEGWASFGSTASHQGTIELDLVPIGDRERGTDEIREILMPLLEVEPDVELTYSTSGGPHTFMNQPDIIVEIYGHDQDVGKVIGTELAAQIAAVEGIFDVDSSVEEGRPELEVKLDRDYLSSMGLTGSAVIGALSTYMRGTVATYYTEAGREYEVLVVAENRFRDTASAIRDLLVATPTGRQVPMADFINLEPDISPTLVNRKNQQRVVYLNVDVESSDLRGMTNQVSAILEGYAWPEGFTWAIGGGAEDMMESFFWLAIALAGGALLVYMVMASQFESLVDPFIIIFSIPLALIGVVWALLVT